MKRYVFAVVLERRTFAPVYGVPSTTMPFGFATLTMAKEQERQMLEAQAKMLERVPSVSP